MAFTFKLRNETYTASTLAKLSEIYCSVRDASGEGYSTFPTPSIRDGKSIVGKFSYNGRIWSDMEYNPTAKPIYDNRVEA